MTRLRVLVLTRTTALGGAERLVMNTLPYLNRESFDYRFAALDEGGPLALACTARGHEFAVLRQRALGDPRPLFALRRMLKRDRIDVLHAHLPVPGALARVAARGTGARVVYTEHSVQDAYRAPSRWLNARSYAWQDLAIAVSERVGASASAHAGRAARGRIAVVPSGVDLEEIERESARPPDPDPPRSAGAEGATLLVPASLTPVKGHDVLLEALARLGPGSPLDVWLAGEGAARATLEARAAALGPSGRAHVHFLGARRDVFSLMRAADLVALPSRREGLPLALLEALALGRPVVASAVGGVPEVVTHGSSGWLVPAGNPDALAASLGRLLGDPALRERLGRAARREVRRDYDVRRTVAAVEALYLRSLEKAQATASASST